MAGIMQLLAVINARGQHHHACQVHLPGLAGYENPLNEKWLSAYDVKAYHLELAVSNTDTEIGGTAAILVESVREMDTLVLQLRDVLTVDQIRLSNDIYSQDFTGKRKLSFSRRNDALYLNLDGQVPAGELFQVCITYHGDAGQGSGFFSGVTSKQDYDYGFNVTYTLSEPRNARDWFPVKQVLEDKIDSVTFRIRCDSDLMAGSNGLLVSVEEEGQQKVYTWKTAYPMAYYLISFAVADYRDLSFQAPLSEPGDSVQVQNFIYDRDQVLADWEDEIRKTGPMMQTFSSLLVDYPFHKEKYGHCMAPMGGGMEHQTMTTLQDFDFFLVAHELAHQWFGDHITCGSWQDIWINEGFASYMEYVAGQEILSQEAADAWMNNAMSVALGETRGSVYVPEEQADDTYRVFDYGLSYKKGAILLHMIRFILDDDDLFFGILTTYLEQYGNGNATGNDFQALLEAESGIDFSCFFQQWYYGEGYPHFTVYWEQVGDTLMLRSEQEGTEPSITPFFNIPVEIEARITGSEPVRFRIEQDQPVQTFAVSLEGRVENVIFDPDQNLLHTATVFQDLPSGRLYRFGPNPVSGELYVQFPSSGRFEEIRITSLSGREVRKWTDTDNPVTMDLSSLADGPYLLELTNERGTFLEQIVKISAN
jgi:aminopeptidase N